MAETTYLSLAPRIVSVTKGAPNPTVILALQSVARDFYRRSEAYRYPIAATDVTALATSISPTLPASTEIYRPGDMTFVDDPLFTTSIGRVNEAIGRWDDVKNAVAYPSHIMKAGPTSLSLAPLPSNSDAGALRGTVVLIPSLTATGVEEEFISDYTEILASGAIAHLSSMKGTDWYAPDILDYYRRLFEAGIYEASRRAQNEHTQNTGTTSYGGI